MSTRALLDPITVLGGPARPAGDPDAVRAAAHRLAGAAEQLDRLAARTGAVVAQARSAWSGTASDAFAATGSQLRSGTATDADTLRAAAGALTTYAARLDSAQSAWSNASARAESAVALAPATTPEDLRVFALQASEAATDAQVAAAQLAAELDALTSANIDPATALTLGRVIGLEAGGHSNTGFDLVKHGLVDPMSILTGSYNIAAALKARRGLRQFRAAEAQYNSLVLTYFARNGSGPSLGAFNIKQTWLNDLAGWLPAERAALAARLVEETQGTQDRLHFLRNANAVGDADVGMRNLRAAGDWLGPVGMGFDAYTVVFGSDLPGDRGTVDRWVSGAGFVSGAVGIASALGLVVLAPPAAVAIGVVAVGTGLWSLGNVAYDNRQEIAEFLVNANETKDRLALGGIEAAGVHLGVRGAELEGAGHQLASGGAHVASGLDSMGASAAARADQFATRMEQTADELRTVGYSNPVTPVTNKQVALAVDGVGFMARGAGQLHADASAAGGHAVKAFSTALGDGLRTSGQIVGELGDGVRDGAPVIKRILGL